MGIRQCRGSDIRSHGCSAGDQEDVGVLDEILEDAKQFSGYDIIVDDGGHKARQMLVTFKVCSDACLPRTGRKEV
jgi:hypothetical protein